MTYTRKTVDEWQIWTNYGYGWEHETTETTRKEAQEQKKVYLANATGLHGIKIIKKRVTNSATQGATMSTTRNMQMNQQELNELCNKATGDGIGFVGVVNADGTITIRRDEIYSRSTTHIFTTERAKEYLFAYQTSREDD